MDIKAALVQQPVSIAVDSSSPEFYNYTTGVLTSSSCGTTLTHAILAVGYGITTAG